MSAEPMKPLVAESEVLPPIIIKKITVAGHGGHHGGAWKVAYADFVTAMMAFFLLLWIVGATNEDQRKGIADRSEEHTSELQSLMRISYAVFCLKKKTQQ